MNVTEASQTNTLLRYLLGEGPDAGDVITSAEAQTAAFYLAGRAHMALSAGLNGPELQRKWPQRPEALARKRHDRLISLLRDFVRLTLEGEIKIVPKSGSALLGRELFFKIQTQLKQERPA